MAIDPKTTADLVGALLSEHAARIEKLEKRPDQALAIDAIGTGVAELRARVDKLERAGAPVPAPVAYKLVLTPSVVRVGQPVVLTVSPPPPQGATVTIQTPTGAVAHGGSWTPKVAGQAALNVSIATQVAQLAAFVSFVTVLAAEVPPPPPPAPPPPPPPPSPPISSKAPEVGSQSDKPMLGLWNDTLAVMPAKSITRPVGYAFRRGDVPLGKVPTFWSLGATGTWMRSMISGVSRYDDGSMRFASFRFELAHDLAPGECLRMVMEPAISGVSDTPMALDAPADIRIEAVGAHNLAGRWTARPDRPFDTAELLTQMRGGIGVSRKVKAQFYDDMGNVHPSLLAWFWVTVTTAGTFLSGAVSQPWLQASPKPDDDRWTAFEDIAIYQGSKRLGSIPLSVDGDTTIRYQKGGRNGYLGWYDDAKKLTHAAALLVTGEIPGVPMPAGIEVGKVYGLGDGHLHSDGPGVGASSYSWSGEVPKVEGQGFRATSLRWVGRGVMPFFVDEQGDEFFIPENGGAQALVTPVHDREYLRSTRMIPPLRLTHADPNVMRDVVADYRWGWSDGGAIQTHEPETGGRPTLGPVHLYHARHFANPTSRNFRTMVTLGLLAGYRHTMLLDRDAGGAMYRIRDAEYPGLSTISFAQHRWYSDSRNGLPAGVDLGHNVASADAARVGGGRLGHTDDQHTNCLLPYSYLVTGRLEFIDHVATTAIQRIAMRPASGKKFSYRGRDYQGVFGTNGAARADAWEMRDIMAAIMLLPDSHPAKKMMLDAWRDTMAFWAAVPDDQTYALFRELGNPNWYNCVEASARWWPKSGGGMFATLYMWNMLAWIDEVERSSITRTIVEGLARHLRLFWQQKRLPTISAYYTKWWPLEGTSIVPTHMAQVGQALMGDWSWTEDDVITIKNVGGAKSAGGVENMSLLRGLTDGDQIAYHDYAYRNSHVPLGCPSTMKPYEVYTIRAPMILGNGDVSFRLEKADGTLLNWPEAGAAKCILTGIFAAGFNARFFTDPPPSVQALALARVLRAKLGNEHIPAALVADIETWHREAGIGASAYGSNLNFDFADGWE